jgi:hypothetical protein
LHRAGCLDKAAKAHTCQTPSRVFRSLDLSPVRFGVAALPVTLGAPLPEA